MQVKIGDTVIIRNNSVFGYMGFFKVEGIVMRVNDTSVAFRCRQTNAIETADFIDGDWRVITKEFKASLKQLEARAA